MFYVNNIFVVAILVEQYYVNNIFVVAILVELYYVTNILLNSTPSRLGF